MNSGFATAEGTARYAQRFPQAGSAGHFRRPEWVKDVGELTLSSIGIGTYLGETDDAADRAYTAAVSEALRSGVNVVDTAINYRHQRSERNIGAALAEVIGAGQLRRDEVLVCSKAGYLTFDRDMPPDPRAYFMQEYVEPGILDPAEIAGGMHCMAPRFLADQLERSRRNLGLETIDVFYVHNPEAQLAEIPPSQFVTRLTAAFAELENAVQAGKIRCYGVASWNAFRVNPGDRGYMPLEAVLHCAFNAGGEEHHFRFIQLPFNLAMTEAWSANNHQLDEARGRGVGAGVCPSPWHCRRGQRHAGARQSRGRTAGLRQQAPGNEILGGECHPVCAIQPGIGHCPGRHGQARARQGGPRRHLASAGRSGTMAVAVPAASSQLRLM